MHNKHYSCPSWGTEEMIKIKQLTGEISVSDGSIYQQTSLVPWQDYIKGTIKLNVTKCYLF